MYLETAPAKLVESWEPFGAVTWSPTQETMEPLVHLGEIKGEESSRDNNQSDMVTAEKKIRTGKTVFS